MAVPKRSRFLLLGALGKRSRKRMYLRFLIVISSLFFLISCNSTTATVDGNCISQNASRFIEPEKSLYNLPFGVGEGYQLGQGNCTFHTHSTESKSEFAFDFIMDIGTPIHAARSGQVVSIEDRFFDGNRIGSDFNHIIIAHENNTFSSYIHLTNAGVIVEPGEYVNQGDVIGYSGDTGMSSAPHLHFEVFQTNDDCFKKGVDGRCPTIPVSFKNASPSDKILTHGLVYTAL
ncbi:M23 family metallopeptidase [Pseudoalteromonas sp. H105]|uniref:M23 family metallopeptidase n=1 Tax=Pseudoalteromonas sp. H105 TaxID=1348393 RepID=UPI0009E71F87|nr:M23 family metallopeptidase [Pseudoalteromonas sp. H105]